MSTLPTTFDIHALATAIEQTQGRLVTLDDPIMARLLTFRLAGLEEAWTLLTGRHDPIKNAMRAGDKDLADVIMGSVDDEVATIAKDRTEYVATVTTG